MGGSKHADDNNIALNVIVQPPGQEDMMIHCLCTEARLQEVNAVQCMKLVLIGKLYSECHDLFFHIDECQVEVTRFVDEDPISDISLLSRIKEAPAILDKMEIFSELYDKRANKLRKRCLKEIKMTEMAVADVTNHNMDYEEFFQLYGVDPEFITSYVIPKLVHIKEGSITISSIITCVKKQIVICHRMLESRKRFEMIQRKIDSLNQQEEILRIHPDQREDILRTQLQQAKVDKPPAKDLKGMVKMGRWLVKFLRWPRTQMAKVIRLVKKRDKATRP